VAVERPAYSAVLQQTNDEALLANLARLRYGDTCSFVEVTGIVSQVRFDAIGEASAEGGPSSSFVGARASAGFSQQPTISYAPLQGEAFARRLLAPIPTDNLVLLLHSGWGARRVFALAVESLGGVRNTYEKGEREDAAYARLLQLLTDLYNRRAIDFTYETAPPDATSKLPARIVLQVMRTTPEDPALGELLRLLDLVPGQRHYPLVYPSVVHGEPTDGKTLLIAMRSTLGVMNFLTQGVEPCEDDVKRGQFGALPTKTPRRRCRRRMASGTCSACAARESSPRE
jgi:hypothetical protein